MRVFIVRPVGKNGGVDFDMVERKLIAPAMAAAKVTGGTTGLIARSGNIRVDMFEQLVLADLVIADISVHNANVFYELGLRHALRHRPTILIRFKRSAAKQPRNAGGKKAGKKKDKPSPDDVPFDLKTDRYLEYDLKKLASSVPALTQAIQETRKATNIDSPVYLLLPELRPPATGNLRPVAEEFREAVAEAAAKDDFARLGLLAEEIDDVPWKQAGRRLVGKTFFDKKSWAGARIWLEQVRTEDPDDVEASLLLGTVYQKLGDLAESNAALARVLEQAAIRALGEPLAREPETPKRQRVLLFSGHRIDRPGRKPPRFPASREAAAAAAIRKEVLHEKAAANGVPIKGIAGAANGGDIIFHEVCRAEGIPTEVLLALPENEYAAESVDDGGPEWTERFRRLVRETPPSILGESQALPPWVAGRDNYSIWNRNNLWTLHAALAHIHADVTLIALFDGRKGDGPGGTFDMIQRARAMHVNVIQIDPAELAD
jgi:hypothetical protein